MRLTHIRANSFRCFEQIEMRPARGMNVILGENASGKTSVLEAIFLLGRGRSFRGGALNTIDRHGDAPFVLRGRTESDHGLPHQIGMARGRGGLDFKLDSDASSTRFDLVNLLPMQLVDPNLHRILEQGPQFRRQFLDWGVFHVEHEFFSAWRSYRRALRQRNHALRGRQAPSAVTAWDYELERNTLTIDRCRRNYVERLIQVLPATVERILGEDMPSINYYPGWREEEGFSTALKASLEKDRRAGYTHVGPHRADLRIDVAGVRARARVSRGQQKVFATALLLTQARILRDVQGIAPILLVDDLAAELSAGYQRALLDEIAALESQCFVTYLDVALIPSAVTAEARMFHVEHRAIRQLP